MIWYFSVIAFGSLLAASRYLYIEKYKASAKAGAPRDRDTLQKLNDVRNASPYYNYEGKAYQLEELESCLRVSRSHLSGYLQARREHAYWWQTTYLRAIAEEEWLQAQLTALLPEVNGRVQREKQRAEESRRQDALSFVMPVAAQVHEQNGQHVIDAARVRACFEEVLRRIGGADAAGS